MLTLDNLSEYEIAEVVKPTILKRSRKYMDRVSKLERDGNQLSSKVRGAKTYDVRITVTAGEIQGVCNCRYDWGGYCKHIGATLLKWIGAKVESEVEEVVKDPAGLDIKQINHPSPYLPEHLPTWPTDTLAEIRKEDQKRFADFLNEHKVTDLRKIAKKIGCNLSGTRKNALTQQLVTYLCEQGHAIRLIQGLDEELQAVLYTLMTLGERVNFPDEDFKHLVEKSFRPLSRYKKLDTYFQRLAEQGLLISRDVYSHYTRFGFIPFPIWQASPPPLEGVLRGVQSELEGGEYLLSNPAGYLTDIHQLITYLTSREIALRPPQPRPKLESTHQNLQGWPYVPQEIVKANADGILKRRVGNEFTIPVPNYPLPDKTIQTLTSTLNCSAEQLNFSYQLLVQAGLFMHGTPITPNPDYHQAFFQHGAERQRAVLSQAYFALASWNEMWPVLRQSPKLQLKRVESYRAYNWPTLQVELSGFRYMFLRALANIPNGQWVSLSDFFKLLHDIVPRFDANALQSPGWGYGDKKPIWHFVEGKKVMKPQQNRAQWRKVQGAYLKTMLMAPLHWLGWADLYQKGNELVAFRLTGLSDLFLERTDTPPLPGRVTLTATPANVPAEALTIDHLTIIVNPTKLSGKAHSYLNQIAELENASPNRFTFQLSASQVHTYFEAGLTLDQLLEGWKKYLSKTIPPAIEEQLTTWWNTYGTVRLYQNVSVIELADDYALTELKAVTKLDEWLIAEISPRLLMIRPEGIKPLINQLKKAGYTPKETDKT